METNKISPDDPRLTAYALDEMAPAERAEFAHALQQDAGAMQLVAEIRAAGAALATVLEQEPLPTGTIPLKPVPARGPYAKLVRFPYWTVSSLAAACFTVVFIYWQSQQVPVEKKQYIEMPLSGPVDAKAKAAVDQMADSARSVIVELPTTLEAQSPAPVGSLAQMNDTIKLEAFSVAAPPALSYTPVAGARLDETSVRGATGGGVSLGWASARGRVPASPQDLITEAYAFKRDNTFQAVAQHPLSTFAADVDTASYANVRRFLRQGQRPPADAVRIEELVNYFPYRYAGPEPDGGRVSSTAKDHDSRGEGTPPPVTPFAANLEVAGAPWASAHRLVRIGIKGRELSDAARPAANLVFLLDVSGSMNQPNKLPLVKQSLRLLVEKLRPDDQVAIAVYAGASGLALPSTPASHKAEILEAIDRLEAGGSTNGALGIQLAYDLAKAHFITGGVNRVILATDGDFNVGVTSEGGLVRLVEEKAKTGVFLTVLGFGMGNYKDSTLEQLADKGNGNYAYIDNLAEAKKTLVEQAGGTLVTIAKDVKLQVEFNPATVQAYRLIGYENRLLAKEDFNNDQVDAGEIGAGHTVTALYEVVPAGAEMPAAGSVDALKYQAVNGATATSPSKQRGEVAASPEMLTVKIRFKEPAGTVSLLREFPLVDNGAVFAAASQDFKFATAVAAFGMVLRDSPHKGTATLADVLAWGRAGVGSDAGGYRTEFLGLVERAQAVVQ